MSRKALIIVIAELSISGKEVDLAARRLDHGRLAERRKLEVIQLHPPICTSIIFQIEIVLPCKILIQKSIYLRENTHLTKWTKHAWLSVPLPSCCTKSCSTYSFQTSFVLWTSNEVKGYGLFALRLRIETFQKRGCCANLILLTKE